MGKTWDAAAVKHYQDWFETPRGAFALAMERRLIERHVAGWHRRQAKLVEIGCGPGLFLDRFYDLGFDVTGLDASPSMLAAARNRLGKRAELHQGVAEHLPYEDGEFDYAVLLTVLEFNDEPGRVLAEAARVAKKGVLVGFLNRNSLYYLSHGLRLPFRRLSFLRTANWRGPGQVKRLMRRHMARRPVTFGSVLPGPPGTWREAIPWKWLNGLVYPGCLGAYCVARMDFLPERALTPLPAKVRETAGAAG